MPPITVLLQGNVAVAYGLASEHRYTQCGFSIELKNLKMQDCHRKRFIPFRENNEDFILSGGLPSRSLNQSTQNYAHEQHIKRVYGPHRGPPSLANVCTVFAGEYTLNPNRPT